MIHEISILIPCYNDRCSTLVKQLHGQLTAICNTIEPFNYEILVADDGSTNVECIESNKAINGLKNCRYIIRGKNVGRAAIRNFLAGEAKYKWLLFIDSDMVVDNDKFIKNYLSNKEEVVVGGIKIGGDADLFKDNIRYKYEKASEQSHNAEQRQLKPNKEFRTTNFLINKEIIKKYPFNEKFIYYGYEDVLMGKILNEHHIKIKHINNPVLLNDYEDNPTFIKKTEESLRTLYQFRKELKGYSTLLHYIHKIKSYNLLPIILTANKIFGKSIRHNLTSNKPRLFLFNIYKLFYYVSLL